MLVDDDDEKARDHCHITIKFRVATHWSWNINLQLTKNVLVIFHNLRGYGSQLLFNELNKFDAQFDVIPNRKIHGIFLNKNLAFIDSMQFMNSSLEKQVKTLTDDDFKYLTEEFGSRNLEFLTQKEAYPCEYMGSFKKFNEEKLPDKKCFYSSVKDGTTDDNSEKLDGQISHKDYLTCKKIWMNLAYEWLSRSLFEKDVLLLADVFKNFIDTCLKFCKLDPCH